MTRADTLLQIKDAEAKAAQTIKDAQERQRAIVANARRDSIKRIQDAEAKMMDENERFFANEKAKVGTTKVDLIKKGEEDAKATKVRSTSKSSAVRQHLKESFDRSI